MKTLVVYYSRTGVTREVAHMIADQLKSDLEQVQEQRNRMGMVGFLRCCFEALCKKTPPIKAAEQDPVAYDLVIIGTPVWAGNLASPVRSYLDQKEGYLPAVAFFITSGGSHSPKIISEMQELCHHEAVASLELKDKEVKVGSCAGEIKKFTDALSGWSRS